MSTLSRINFEPVSDILPVWRRDLPLADPTLADPDNAVALVDGEWVSIDAAYKWVRASTIGTPGNLAASISYPIFNEKGRFDRQAMAERKSTALYLGDYEFDTRIFDATVALGSGAAITAVNQPLKVATVTFSGRNFVGLVGHGGSADTDPVRGYVTKLPAINGGKLRFRSGWRT
jgi:hypothetical protein